MEALGVVRNTTTATQRAIMLFVRIIALTVHCHCIFVSEHNKHTWSTGLLYTAITCPDDADWSTSGPSSTGTRRSHVYCSSIGRHFDLVGVDWTMGGLLTTPTVGARVKSWGHFDRPKKAASKVNWKALRNSLIFTVRRRKSIGAWWSWRHLWRSICSEELRLGFTLRFTSNKKLCVVLVN